MKIKDTLSIKLFHLFSFIILFFLSILCILPLWLVLAGSFSSDQSIVRKGYSLIPRDFTLEAYKFLFTFPEDIIRAYAVSIGVTVIGTLLGLFLISMAGYVLQRTDLKHRSQISFFIYFTTIFQGGLIPWYILVVNYLHLNDTYAILILVGLSSPFLIILMRSFIKASIPSEMIESAKIDGAGDFKIYYNIVLPLAKPALATVGLFLALNYWNDWFSVSLFIEDKSKYNLQFFMYNMLTQAQVISQLVTSGSASSIRVPTETAKLAISVIAIGPIVLLYPFLQRFFVKGLTLGAVKG
ncbi:carbohydrate ABC transporter permease [Paenibacillus psychroresistens]|uniref:Carbohydrate ABC transporter permease n=1 Tax=Paenibacillus psychroresistens TaxID=1778678 RepID=A0A6B8RTL5_9BACL|nr:carbohydrate ABC transporter permease [Paenibacillus psychroresistens]QGQ99860.1 carbohydrate ABC transporter permease [Paenibacillus psychroresistens]